MSVDESRIIQAFLVLGIGRIGIKLKLEFVENPVREE